MIEMINQTGRTVKNSILWFYLSTLTGILSWRVAWVFGLMLLISFTEGFGLLMLIPLLQLVGLEVDTGTLSRFSESIARAFGIFSLRPTLPAVLTLFGAVMVIRSALARYQAVVTPGLVQTFVTELRERLFEAISDAQWLFFTQNRSSDFFHVLASEIGRVGGATHTFLSLLVGVVVTLVYFTLALLLSPFLTLLVCFCGVTLLLLLRHKAQQARERGNTITSAYEGMFASVSEHLSGMKTSKSHGVEAHHTALFTQTVNDVKRAHIEVAENFAEVKFWFEVGSVVVLILILYAALEAFAIPTAEMLLLLLLFARLVPRFSGLQNSYQQFINDLPAFENVMSLQARCEAASEPKGSTERLELRQVIRFQGVSFRYEDEGAPILDNLTLNLEAGKTSAVVGSSGAGKSTIADLAVGLISPKAGHILIDNLPLDDKHKRTWRTQIGYVSQDTFLFHDTIRANLQLTKPGASDEEIFEVLASAAARAFVNGLPEGLDTVVGDRGVKLSGGERQRLALARALLRRPTLLVLDEATSSLDTENEKHIQRAIEGLHGQMTILVIAHRLSTIKNADVIYVLEHGKLVESGTWRTLITKEKGRFRALCEAQGLLLTVSVSYQVER